MPTVFSMLHPLDEIAPVVFKPSGRACTILRKFTGCLFIPFFVGHTVFVFFLNNVVGFLEGSHVQYMSDSTMKIVFTCCQPSIVVSYDTVQGAHTVWALRKVTQDVSAPINNQKKKKLLVFSNLEPFFLGAFHSLAESNRSSWDTAGPYVFQLSNISFAQYFPSGLTCWKWNNCDRLWICIKVQRS